MRNEVHADCAAVRPFIDDRRSVRRGVINDIMPELQAMTYPRRILPGAFH